MTADDYFQLGLLYEKQNLHLEAGEKFKVALKQNKDFEPALMALGNQAFEEGNYQQAEHYYRRVLRKNSAHGGANNNLAMVYLKTNKNLKIAERLATRALETAYRPYAEDTLAQIKASAN